MRALLVAAALALAAPVAAKSAATTKAFPFPIEEHTLANGLRVVLVKYDSPGLVAYFTLMRVGSRNEAERGRSGYAHFFEHMMFRGTKKHSGADYNQTVTRLGLNTNAFTSEEVTCFHARASASRFGQLLDVLTDMLPNSGAGAIVGIGATGGVCGAIGATVELPLRS